MGQYERRLLEALVNNLRALRDEVRAIRENQQATNDASNDEPIQPLPVEIVHAPDLDPARREYYVAENRERNSAWTWFKRIGETIGVVVAVTLAILTLLTFWQIRKQTPKMAESADAAKRAAVTASDSLQEAKRINKVSLRAYVVETGDMDTTNMPPHIGFRIAVRTTLKNVGKSIARDVIVSYVLRPVHGNVSPGVK
jgi:hypothetical protein